MPYSNVTIIIHTGRRMNYHSRMHFGCLLFNVVYFNAVVCSWFFPTYFFSSSSFSSLSIHIFLFDLKNSLSHGAKLRNNKASLIYPLLLLNPIREQKKKEVGNRKEMMQTSICFHKNLIKMRTPVNQFGTFM